MYLFNDKLFRLCRKCTVRIKCRNQLLEDKLILVFKYAIKDKIQ